MRPWPFAGKRNEKHRISSVLIGIIIDEEHVVSPSLGSPLPKLGTGGMKKQKKKKQRPRVCYSGVESAKQRTQGACQSDSSLFDGFVTSLV